MNSGKAAIQNDNKLLTLDNIKKEVVISKSRVIKKVIQIDIETQKTIAIYNNLHDAGRALGNEDYRKHIGDVCNGYRKTAYGYM